MIVRFWDGSELVWPARLPAYAAGCIRRDPRRFAHWPGLHGVERDVLRQCRALLAEDAPAASRALDSPDVVATIRRLVRVGRLWWVEWPSRRPVRPVAPAGSGSTASPPPASPPAGKAAAAANASSAATSAGGLSASVDQACLADVLVQAAAIGTPFCEECQLPSSPATS